MPFDWNTVINSQDQSLEAILARQDMSKNMQMLQQVKQEAERQRSNQVDESQRATQLKQQNEQHVESVKYRQQQDEKSDERARVDDERARFSTSIQGRTPGQVYDKAHMDLEGKYGNPQEYEQDPKDSNKFIYRRHEGERIIAKAKQDEEIELQQRADAKERLKLAQEENARQREELDLRRKDEQRKVDRAAQLKQAHEQRMKKIVADAGKLPAMFGQQFNKLTEDIMEENKAGWLGLGEEGAFAARESAAAEALRRLQSKVPGNVSAPPLGGRGAGPGGAAGAQPATPAAGSSRFTIVPLVGK
jgi:hypothetical protein